VYRGLNLLDDNENFMIFNCDSCFDDLSFFNKLEELINNYSVDGCIPYFISTDKLDNKWSFLETQNNKIISIKEKQKISDKASIGLYYFKSKLLYEKYYKKAFDNFSLANELYVSNVYEKMLKDNLDIYAIKVNNFECFGTPEELENFKSKYINLEIHSSF
jgi:NDP-sugar pyrophosphorylase family protein